MRWAYRRRSGTCWEPGRTTVVVPQGLDLPSGHVEAELLMEVVDTDCRTSVQRDRVPEDLALVGTVDGQRLVRHVPLSDVRAANDGRLSEALHMAHRSCGVGRVYDTG